jgi:hypothetical protein
MPASASLAASSTTTVAAYNYAPASYVGCELHYTIKQATTNYYRSGVIYVANNTDGSGVSYTDTYVETATIGVTASVALDSGSIKFSFNNADGNACTIQAKQSFQVAF